jgi:hypothetical protein
MSTRTCCAVGVATGRDDCCNCAYDALKPAGRRSRDRTIIARINAERLADATYLGLEDLYEAIPIEFANSSFVTQGDV